MSYDKIVQSYNTTTIVICKEGLREIVHIVKHFKFNHTNGM